jgi:hypothetical protein
MISIGVRWDGATRILPGFEREDGYESGQARQPSVAVKNGVFCDVMP